ncbi:MAG: hypothetical protein ACU85E_18235 [Gammaproteobacteria bacterium]
MLPSQITGIEKYPALKYVFEKQLDRSFVELRCLLQAPFDGCPTGMPLTTASILVNFISGFSRRLYRPEDSPNDGERFKKMLIEFFPWCNDELNKAEAADLLYYSLRNPLTHELGIKGKNVVYVVQSGKLSPEEVDELESSSSKPEYLPPPIAYVEVSRDRHEWHVSVTSLYWAVYVMLKSLINCELHAINANARLQKLLNKSNRYEA